MRMRLLVPLVAAAILSLPSIAAAEQRHVADRPAITAALERHAADAETKRAAIASVLERVEVRQIAERLGLDLRGVDSAVTRLSGRELADATAAASRLERGLSGGDPTITISLTTLLLVILLVVLIAD
jgi:hypothetical protein